MSGLSIASSGTRLFTMVKFVTGTVQTVATATSAILNLWNEEVYDDVGAWDISAPDRIIVPAGFSYCSPFFHVEFAIVLTAGPCSARIFVNGAAPAGNYLSPALSGHLSTLVSTQVGNQMPKTPCIAGDYFGVRVRQDSGLDMDFMGSRAMWWGVEWLR
ncbi:MAG: hypothetical protein NUV80_03850 [Candidatus Berkelbacteria bacterium]|nr:hypothetical protein [Candidatus Berkelbacteria bacterium]